MTTRKNYNSIVFLTTLSVYLGLVLVGAPAPVLAQAALTGRIEVKDKIEKKDDLDKKLDDDNDEIELSGPTGGYFDDLKDLVEDLQKLHQIEKFNLNFDIFKVEQTEAVQCDLEIVRHAVITSNINNNNRWLTPAFVDTTYRFENYGFLGDCLPSDKFGKNKAVNYGLKFSYDKSVFKFEVSLTKQSQQKAKELLEKFNQAYDLYKPDVDEVILKQIYENTSFSSENNQVFIVTRLPRGSLDALIAKDAQ